MSPALDRAPRPALDPVALALILAPMLTACAGGPTPRVSPTPSVAPSATLVATTRPMTPPAKKRPPIKRKPAKARLGATATPAKARPVAKRPPARALGQPVAGARHLARLHPEVRRMARALYEEAAAAGIELTFISGHRAFRPTSAKARAGRASWHAFGMAFDINLADRDDMKDALAHFDRDRARWDRVGQIGERLGLTWGLQWGRAEVFHFEWHPGMPEAIRRPTLKTLLSHAGADGSRIERVWRLFEPEEADHAHVARRRK